MDFLRLLHMPPNACCMCGKVCKAPANRCQLALSHPAVKDIKASARVPASGRVSSGIRLIPDSPAIRRCQT